MGRCSGGDCFVLNQMGGSLSRAVIPLVLCTVQASVRRRGDRLRVPLLSRVIILTILEYWRFLHLLL